jgi:uncharacterized protein YaaQ
MKMVMAVVSRDEAERVLQDLTEAGHTATFTESRGGMLRQAQQMLFIAVKNDDLEKVLAIVHGGCHSQVEVECTEPDERLLPASAVSGATLGARVGGAVVFVWDLEHFAIY